MKIITFLTQLGIIAVLALSGCNMYTKTYSNHDRSVDFTKYKTYAWLNSQKSQVPTPYYNDVIENNAKSYIDHHVEDRGLTVDTLNPDVLIELVLKSEKKKEEVQVSNPYNYSTYTYYNHPYNHNYNDNLYFGNQYYNFYPNYNYTMHYSYNPGYRSKIRKYTQSTITINVIDRASNKLVWTGSAENDIYNTEYLKEKIHPAVVNILKQYPVKPTKK
jgi:hypothetical protein